jgi:hypothetical protein
MKRMCLFEFVKRVGKRGAQSQSNKETKRGKLLLPKLRDKVGRGPKHGNHSQKSKHC